MYAIFMACHAALILQLSQNERAYSLISRAKPGTILGGTLAQKLPILLISLRRPLLQKRQA